jgi:hypothetical protein
VKCDSILPQPGSSDDRESDQDGYKPGMSPLTSIIKSSSGVYPVTVRTVGSFTAKPVYPGTSNRAMQVSGIGQR